jgi:two-component system response regulator PilR (NtrC family)
MAHLLVVDDQKSICEMLDIALRKEGHRVETVTSLDLASKRLQSAIYDVVITDIRLSDGSGLDVLQKARETRPETAVILITAYASVDSAVQALNLGAFRYIIKTANFVEELRLTVEQVVELRVLRHERDKRQVGAALENLLGNSSGMKAVKDLVATVAPTNSTILVTGESGTGKELVARAVHVVSGRHDRPFVSINCGAFPETLLESELFGYLRGAFTGANASKKGLFEFADTGTLFLDEIAEMSLAMQVKLLRVLQERLVRPLGASEEVPVDVRLIAATNKDLQQRVKEGLFREDLYYRISVIPIELPPLRDRREDIPLLALHFLSKFARTMNKPMHKIDGQAMKCLERYDWPCNVRELENAIERAVALEKSEEITIWTLPERVSGIAPGAAAGVTGDGALAAAVLRIPEEGLDLERVVADERRRYMLAALHLADGMRNRAADLLGMSYRSFRHYAKKYRL